MINRNELAAYCTMTGFNPSQAERDYLQHLFLLFLSEHATDQLVFKGGTALQKVYGLNRASIDLDFTQRNDADLKELMQRIAESITLFGYKTEIKELETAGKTFILKIEGPLYSGNPVSLCSLRIEISQRESVLLKPNLKEVTPVYRDLRPYLVLVMNEAEILAEKVRAIMTRNKPRDVYDIHFLIRKDVKPDIEFINKKLNYYKEKYDAKSFTAKLKEKKKLWDTEMKKYVTHLPDFDTVFGEIMKKMS